MKDRIRNNFKILKARKEQELGRQLTYVDITNDTGISPNTLSSYAQNKVSRYDEDTLIRLCRYFDCTLPDLLEYPPIMRRENQGLDMMVMA